VCIVFRRAGLRPARANPQMTTDPRCMMTMVEITAQVNPRADLKGEHDDWMRLLMHVSGMHTVEQQPLCKM
jgi:hypothetical protein